MAQASVAGKRSIMHWDATGVTNHLIVGKAVIIQYSVYKDFTFGCVC